jgi:tRNA dimethylallyltransferase
MVRHRSSCNQITENLDSTFVLDAGTGMYLNGILLDIPLAPKVEVETRRHAESLSKDAPNPRRKSRELELEISGFERRSSIWDGDLRYDATIVYLRPDKGPLDASISRRTKKISREGLEEAAKLVEKFPGGLPNPSARDAIGVKELVSCTQGDISIEEAKERIQIRTRQLARRQMKWFDKLAHTLQGRAEIIIAEDQSTAEKAVHDYADQL